MIVLGPAAYFWTLRNTPLSLSFISSLCENVCTMECVNMKKFTIKLWAVLLLMLVSLQTFATDNEYGLKDNIQDGVILHCFDWTYAQIKEELPNIAAAGFSAVQTSPAHPREPVGLAVWNISAR